MIPRCVVQGIPPLVDRLHLESHSSGYGFLAADIGDILIPPKWRASSIPLLMGPRDNNAVRRKDGWQAPEF